MTAKVDNPVLVIAPRAQDSRQREVGGFGEAKEFVEVTPAFRRQLVNRIQTIADSIRPSFDLFPDVPAVLSMRLHKDALAKSHRPMRLLERVNMNPIGTRNYGEFLLPATESSLTNLIEIISNNNAKNIKANISTISELSAWSSMDVFNWSDLSEEEMNIKKQKLSEWINAGKSLVVERFTSFHAEIDQQIQRNFEAQVRRLDGELKDFNRDSLLDYVSYIKLNGIEDVIQLATFPGVRSISPNQEFSPIDIYTQNFREVELEEPLTLPAPDDDEPIVAVVDSGIERNDISLKDWLVGHQTYLLPPDTDNLHGTFVAGLVAGSRVLNSNNINFPEARSKVLDVSALGKGNTSSDELLLRITDAIKNHPDVKIWNCSFSSKQPTDISSFSSFAQELDKLSDKYGVLFVIAAGNYETAPLREWPPTRDLAGQDRIGQPADSLRSISVGSVAHLPKLVKASEPSPFSRRGPGAANVIKPDLVHFGGNCTNLGEFEGLGVISFLPKGKVAESIGTSFSTPLISSMAANLWKAIDQSRLNPSPDLVKGLMIHSAVLSAPKRNNTDRNYYGFGLPQSVLDTLFCSDDTFTMIFEVELYDGIIWEKTPFPVPASLHPNGTHLKSEVFMTLVYSPPLDGRFGAEYVRSNVDASFGSYDPNADGVFEHSGFVPLEAVSHDDLYEKAMIDNGFKWAPVKVYHGKFPRGKKAKNLRLKLELLRRAGEASSGQPQKATVIISFRSVEPNSNIYSEGIRALRNSNWVSNAVSNQSRIRI